MRLKLTGRPKLALRGESLNLNQNDEKSCSGDCDPPLLVGQKLFFQTVLAAVLLCLETQAKLAPTLQRSFNDLRRS